MNYRNWGIVFETILGETLNCPICKKAILTNSGAYKYGFSCECRNITVKSDSLFHARIQWNAVCKTRKKMLEGWGEE